MKTRCGLTLIEIVVAIVILSVGGLALAGTSALMVRRISESARGAAATSVARNRLESSLSSPCSALTSGSEQVFGVRSEWSTTGSAYSTAVSQHVSYPTRRGAHTDHFLTAVPCR
jgi:prepilin-type N-terminal cleavage/methylation domain-containing protein